MRQALVSALLLFLLSACAVGNKYDYRAATPELQARSSGAVAVGVHDKRSYVLSNDKGPNFVGLQRGGYGNPFNVGTLSGHALADDFAWVIVDALRKNDIEASAVRLSPQDGRESALQVIDGADAERVILVTLEEWKSDNFMNVALIYSLSAEVLDERGRVLAATRQQGRDALGAGVGFNLSTAVGGLVIKRSKQVLNALLNDEKIVAALASAPSSPKVAKAAAKPTADEPAATESRPTSEQDEPSSDLAQSARSAEPKTSEADRERIMWFIRNNDNKVKSRLTSYNASKRIGRDGNSPLFKVLTIDDILVRRVDGDRANVILGFSAGYRSFPSYHKYRYDVRLSGGDIVFLGHQKL